MHDLVCAMEKLSVYDQMVIKNLKRKYGYQTNFYI